MSSEFKQNEVSGAIWPWQAERVASTGPTKPPIWKVLAQAGVMVAIGLLMVFRWHHTIPGFILFALAAFVVVSGLFIPKAYAAFERFVGLIAQGVGIALNWILLVPFFYLFFVPARLVMSIKNKDPLRRAFPTSEPTYWVERTEDMEDLTHYRKQYR